MGSWSYTCQLSGLPITSGDLCGIIPIVPVKRYENSEENLNKFGVPSYCSNEGPSVLFKPYCFPIFGKYNDYGLIKDIIKDDNTKVLEEYFNLSIEQIVEVLTDHRKDEFCKEDKRFCETSKILDKNNKRHLNLLSVSCTWIRKEVYDDLSSSYKEDIYNMIELGYSNIFKELGFEITNEIDFNNFIAKKDNFEIIISDSRIKDKQIYNFKDLKEYCKLNNIDIDISNIINKTKVEQYYDYELSVIDELSTYNHRLLYYLLGNEYSVYDNFSKKLMSKSIEKVKEMYKDDEETLKIMLDTIYEKNNYKDNLTLFYFSKIKEYKDNFLRKQLRDWNIINYYYYVTGRYYEPVGTSPQCGEHKDIKKLLEISLNIINKDIKKYDED